MIARLIAGWRGLLASALIGAATAGAIAWEVRGWRDASLIGEANVARIRAERTAADRNAALANAVAAFERARAEDQTQALNAAKAQNRRILDLQSRLAARERERIAESARLKEELSHAPDGDARDLGPAVLEYLARVRAEQTGH